MAKDSAGREYGNGHLGGAPAQAASGWKLRIRRDSREITLYFTPLMAGSASRSRISARWSPRVQRYQAMDSGSRVFVADHAALEPIKMDLRPRQ
jgi:hypothetical protein